MESKKIGITAGHRGFNTGAVGYLNEGQEAIKVRNDIEEILSYYGLKVIKDNNKDNLSKVIKMINRKLSNSDYCIDIHFNSSSSSKANGTEALIYNLKNTELRKLANDLLSFISETSGIKNRGVKDTRSSQHRVLGMLSKTKPQTIILEICFCSNKDDVEKYNANYEQLIEGISQLLFLYTVNKK